LPPELPRILANLEGVKYDELSNAISWNGTLAAPARVRHMNCRSEARNCRSGCMMAEDLGSLRWEAGLNLRFLGWLCK
jgi:hypothetical protein